MINFIFKKDYFPFEARRKQTKKNPQPTKKSFSRDFKSLKKFLEKKPDFFYKTNNITLISL